RPNWNLTPWGWSNWQRQVVETAVVVRKIVTDTPAAKAAPPSRIVTVTRSLSTDGPPPAAGPTAVGEVVCAGVRSRYPAPLKSNTFFHRIAVRGRPQPALSKPTFRAFLPFSSAERCPPDGPRVRPRLRKNSGRAETR